MKKQILKSALIAVAGVGLLTTTTIAAPFNTRTVPINTAYPGELSLQNILDNTIVGASIDAVANQSDAALWLEDEADADAYLISIFTGGSGNLGIYSYSDPTKFHTFNLGTESSLGDNVGFFITDSGTLKVSDGAQISGFGDTFGFYWLTSGGSKYFTEDDKNPTNSNQNKAYALAYQIAGGLTINIPDNTSSSDGGNDWIIAFEDGRDMDYNDAVFYMEDMRPVPEPATMLLFGTGMAGLAAVARRKQKK